jgi:hypothetical protein
VTRASVSKLGGYTGAYIKKVNMRYLITPLLLIATLLCLPASAGIAPAILRGHRVRDTFGGR